MYNIDKLHDYRETIAKPLADNSINKYFGEVSQEFVNSSSTVRLCFTQFVNVRQFCWKSSYNIDEPPHFRETIDELLTNSNVTKDFGEVRQEFVSTAASSSMFVNFLEKFSNVDEPPHFRDIIDEPLKNHSVTKNVGKEAAKTND